MQGARASESWGRGPGTPLPKHVLVVEDEPGLAALLCAALGTDYAVTRAADGHEALHRLTERVPDAIVTDLQMPGMDGVALIARCRADPRLAWVPIILMSACMEVHLIGSRAGAAATFLKPFSLGELSRVLATLTADNDA